MGIKDFFWSPPEELRKKSQTEIDLEQLVRGMMPHRSYFGVRLALKSLIGTLREVRNSHEDQT